MNIIAVMMSQCGKFLFSMKLVLCAVEGVQHMRLFVD